MSEKPDLFPFGYGRGWREPKASGIRRVWQIGREPITKTGLAVACGTTVVLYALALLTLAMFA